MTVRMIPPEVSETYKGTYGAVEFHVERLEGDGVNLSHLLVEPSARRRGEGTRFLAELQRQAKDQGMEYIVANVQGGHETAEFFTECGFEVVEELGSHVTAEREL